VDHIELSCSWLSKGELLNALCYPHAFQVRSLPRTANSSAIKNLKAAAKAYEAIAEAFQQVGNFAKLKAQVLAGKEVWAEVSHLMLERNCFDCYGQGAYSL
jgi:hypothetical protein